MMYHILKRHHLEKLGDSSKQEAGIREQRALQPGLLQYCKLGVFPLVFQR